MEWFQLSWEAEPFSALCTPLDTWLLPSLFPGVDCVSLLPCLLPGQYPAGFWIWYKQANPHLAVRKLLGASCCALPTACMMCKPAALSASAMHHYLGPSDPPLLIRSLSLAQQGPHVHPQNVREPSWLMLPGWWHTHTKPVLTRDDFGRALEIVQLQTDAALGRGGQGNASYSCCQVQ